MQNIAQKGLAPRTQRRQVVPPRKAREETQERTKRPVTCSMLQIQIIWAFLEFKGMPHA
jgi:hypothetical protein